MGYKTISGIGAVGDSTHAFQDEEVFCAAPCKLFSISGYNNGVGTQYLQLWNANAVLAGGEPLIASIEVATQTSVHLTWTLGRPMSIGIDLAWSTTDVTFTVGTAGIMDATFSVN